MEEKYLNSDEAQDALHNSQEEVIDYEGFSQEELLEELKKFKALDAPQIGSSHKDIREKFVELFREEKKEALQRFLDEGGHKDDFEYRASATSREFFELVEAIEKRIKNYYQEQEESRQANLHKKRKLLDELRDLVHGPESQDTYPKVRDIQEEWKGLGGVPQQYNQELWDNYRGLLDIYYNNRSLSFELKELDRKKNLEAKTQLCAKAEGLLEMDDMRQALDKLKQLHEDYKAIGPVPKEVQEELWERFKTASDKVYDKRREEVEAFRKQQEENLQLKQAIIERVKPYQNYTSNRIDDWKQATEAVLECQRLWKLVGSVPAENAKDVGNEFWGLSKDFFNNKKEFFHELDTQREKNLKAKRELCEKVEALVDNDDFGSTAEKIKGLQREWKKVGPVPKKFNEEVFQRFRKACDAFFNKRRESFEAKEKELQDNFEAKKALCDQIAGLPTTGSQEEFFGLVEKWDTIGFVPRANISEIQERYEKVTDGYVDALEGISDEERNKFRLQVQVGSLKNNPNAEKILQKKMQEFRRKISDIENEINNLNTNAGFFANADVMAKLGVSVDDKVSKLEAERKKVKELMKILRDSQKG